MSVTRYILGCFLIGVALGPIIAATTAWRRRLLPQWTGALALLANIILVLAAVLCSLELLGAVRLFRLVPTAVGLALVGLGGLATAYRFGHIPKQSGANDSSLHSGSLAPTKPPRNARSSLIAALIATSVVVADWSTRTVDAFNHGMSNPDTIWYHMPFAARFVQEGSVTQLHFVDFGTDIAFYPANGELVHALGILFFGNDFLSPVINMFWLGLLLLAAWCVGRPFGVAPVTLVGGAVLMATPALVATQPGGAYTDVVGLALIASAVALLVNSEVLHGLLDRWGLVIAAMAAGMALGTKFSFVAPVVILTFGVWIVTARGLRLSQSVVWTLLVMLTGSFWYVRNLVDIGNPLPSFSLHLGPINLRSPPGPPVSSVAQYVFNGEDWRKYFLPGLREALGPAWFLLLGLVGAGLVLGVVSSLSRVRRMIALVGVASAAAYVLSPQPLTVPDLYPNVPYNFVYDLRFSFVAFVIGLTMLPIVAIATRPRAQWWLLSGFGVVLVTTQLDSTLWPTGISPNFDPAIRGTDSYIGLIIGLATLAVGLLVLFGNWTILREPWNVKFQTPAVVAIGLVVLAFGFGIQSIYLRDRYLDTPPMAPVYAWAQGIHNTRIAITGPLTNDSYPLFGKDDSNYVQVVGNQGPGGSFSPILTCTGFLKAIDGGHYADVVTVSTGADTHASDVLSQPTEWIARDPRGKLIFRKALNGFLFKDLVFSVFRITGRLDPSTC